jgi:hypothetical protein
MTGEIQFAIGAKASCSDGSCGEVRRMIIDAATNAVTHLVIGPGHRHKPSRLVPVHLMDTSAGEIRLRCTLAEFDKLDLAERKLANTADEYVGSTYARLAGPFTNQAAEGMLSPSSSLPIVQLAVAASRAALRPSLEVDSQPSRCGHNCSYALSWCQN